MDSKRTTHILLTVIAMGIFFMIFIYMKENYFNTKHVQPVVWEETVPTKPWTIPTTNPVVTPITPTPELNPTPTPTLVTQQNIPLVVGSKYQIMFSGDQHAKPYNYCGQGEKTYDDVSPQSYYYFLPFAQGCSDDMPGGQDDAQYLSLTMFSVSPKPSTTETQIKALNLKYNATIRGKTGENYNIGIDNQTNPYNTYTLTKIYFDSGLFYSTWIKDIRHF